VDAGRMSNLENSTNFLNKFRDSESRQITRLSAHQFMQVWEHYDEDGKLKSLLFGLFQG
jgi:hypothetical protein